MAKLIQIKKADKASKPAPLPIDTRSPSGKRLPF